MKPDLLDVNDELYLLAHFIRFSIGSYLLFRENSWLLIDRKELLTGVKMRHAEGAIRTHGPLREWTLNPSPLT